MATSPARTVSTPHASTRTQVVYGCPQLGDAWVGFDAHRQCRCPRPCSHRRPHRRSTTRRSEVGRLPSRTWPRIDARGSQIGPRPAETRATSAGTQKLRRWGLRVEMDDRLRQVQDVEWLLPHSAVRWWEPKLSERRKSQARSPSSVTAGNTKYQGRGGHAAPNVRPRPVVAGRGARREPKPGSITGK